MQGTAPAPEAAEAPEAPEAVEAAEAPQALPRDLEIRKKLDGLFKFSWPEKGTTSAGKQISEHFIYGTLAPPSTQPQSSQPQSSQSQSSQSQSSQPQSSQSQSNQPQSSQPQSSQSQSSQPQSSQPRSSQSQSSQPQSSQPEPLVKFYTLSLCHSGGEKDRAESTTAGPAYLRIAAKVELQTRRQAGRTTQVVPNAPDRSQIAEASKEIDQESDQAKSVLVIELTGGSAQGKTFFANEGFSHKELIEIPALSNAPLENGIFLTGNFSQERHSEHLTIFLRVPYIGWKKQVTANSGATSAGNTNSWSLMEYRQYLHNLEPPIGLVLTDQAMVVHQAWFVTVDMAAIVASRLISDDNDDPIVFPYQEREGIFHVLVHLVGETFRASDKKICARFNSITACYEDGTHLGDGFDRGNIMKDSLEISTAKMVLESQVSILQDLKMIFMQARSERYLPKLRDRTRDVSPEGSPDDAPAYSDSDIDINSTVARNTMMSIPVLSTFPMEKQRLYTVATLDALIHQRKALSAKCERTLNIIRTAKQSAEIAPHSTEVREGLNTQSSLLAELNDGILWQGKTISIFTCISIVFLPLGFFSQYFALNFEDTAGTAGTGGTPTFNRFWLITGSTTASIAFIMLCFLIDSRYPFRQFLRGLFTLQPNCPTTMVWPLRKQVAQEQRHYLKRLPKYYMEVITAAEANQKRFLEAPTIDTPLTRTSSSDVKLKTCTRDGTKAVVRYDDASGKIFFDQIDRYDYLYRVSVGGANDAGNHHLYWKKTRSEHEETIYRYRPRFTLKATSTASASPNPYTPTELEYLQWSYPTHGSIMDDQPQNPWTCPWWHHESQGVSTVSDFIKLTTELAVPAATQATTTEQAPTCRLRLAPVVQ